MLDHTDPVATIIPAMSLDSPSDNAMAAMSRLALGMACITLSSRW